MDISNLPTALAVCSTLRTNSPLANYLTHPTRFYFRRVSAWHLSNRKKRFGKPHLRERMWAGFGLRLEPGSAEWWWSRLPWLIANAIALIPLVIAFGRFERPGATEGTLAPAWRYVLGALITCGGLALLAAQGVGGYGQFGLNVSGIALAFVGIGLIARRAHAPSTG